MSSRNLQQTLDFIAGLDLGFYDKNGRITLSDNEESALVNDGVCSSFAANITGQMKADVMNSVLLAQLAANAKFNRQTQVDEWYDEYRKVLETVGWIVERFALDKINNTDDYGDVSALVLDIAKAILSPNELPLLVKTIDSLKSGANKDAYRLYNNSAKSAQSANFQVGTVVSSGDDPVFKLTAHTFSASIEVLDILFFSFGSSSVSFRAGYQAMTLNSSFYAKVREAVLEKLGNTVQDFIANINLG
ncbi:unnamed protein product [Peniophora sp. CBMAI 1063]|nr:unnamed protein product [Peniophora sp. CBMAI 1063]